MRPQQLCCFMYGQQRQCFLCFVRCMALTGQYIYQLNGEMQEQHSPYRTWHNFILVRTAPLPRPWCYSESCHELGATGEQQASADSTLSVICETRNPHKTSRSYRLVQSQGGLKIVTLWLFESAHTLIDPATASASLENNGCSPCPCAAGAHLQAAAPGRYILAMPC